MTRGKEVQDFIQANKKSARERFEEAGFKSAKVASYLIYVNRDKDIKITFYLMRKRYGVNGYIGFIDDVDIETHKLITYQLEELGWL